MKRLLCLLVILAGSFSGLAQERPVSSSAALAQRQEAARQETEERFRRMASDIETLTANNQALRDEIDKLNEKIAKLTSEQSRMSAALANNGVQEDLKKLADKIIEVDKKRESDKQVISDEIKSSISKLETAITRAAAVPPPTHTAKPKPENDVPLPDTGFSYTVQAGDSLGAILKAYNAEFKKQGLKPITQKQMMAANPSVKWERLLVGTKLVIPAPPGAK